MSLEFPSLLTALSPGQLKSAVLDAIQLTFSCLVGRLQSVFLVSPQAVSLVSSDSVYRFPRSFCHVQIGLCELVFVSAALLEEATLLLTWSVMTSLVVGI